MADRICEVDPNQAQPVSPQPHLPQTTPHSWSALRSCHVSWPPSEPLLPVGAQNLEDVVAARTEAHLPDTTYAGTPGNLGTTPKSARSRVPAARETPTADVNGANVCTTSSGRLFVTDRRYKAAVPHRHWVGPVRLPEEASPRAQVAHRLQSVHVQRHNNLNLWMDITIAEPGAAL